MLTTDTHQQQGAGHGAAPRVWKIEYLEAKLRRSRAGSEVADIVAFHAREVVDLVNASRRVGATWQRNHGPRFIQAVIGSGFEDDAVIPGEIEGVKLEELLLHMADSLQRFGSPELRRTIANWSLLVLRWARECSSLNELFRRLEDLDDEAQP